MPISFNRILLTAWTVLLLAGAAQAQLNESDTLKFQLRSTLSGNYQKGNVEMLTLRSRLDAVWALSGNFVFKTQNSTLYQSFFGRKADNDLFSRNYLYYRPQGRVYPYAIAYLSTNFRRKVDIRYFAGAGATVQVLRSKHSQLKLSANAVYEQSDFAANTFNDSHYNGSSNIRLWRASAFVMGSSWLFHRRLRFFYDAFWQPALSRRSNYRTQLDLGLEAPLWKGLSLNALYTRTHENVVPLSTQTTDSILTFGLSYAFSRKN